MVIAEELHLACKGLLLTEQGGTDAEERRKKPDSTVQYRIRRYLNRSISCLFYGKNENARDLWDSAKMVPRATIPHRSLSLPMLYLGEDALDE